MIKGRGITVQVGVQTETGVDDMNNPTYDTTYESVDNVLVGNPTESEIVLADQLYGRKCQFSLGIPKTDTHVWENTTVIIPDGYRFSGTYHTIGKPLTGQSNLIPLDWDMNVMVEKIE